MAAIKLMNLSKLLVSVNIAATLPIAVQVAAQASEQNASTEANSLKESVNAISNQPRSSSKVSVASQRFNLAKANPASVEVDGVKLRAFMPGRRLPSNKELVSQRAQFAPERQSSLNGGVSESYAAGSAYGIASDPAGQSAYASSAPRVVLNQMQSVARQIRTNVSKKKTQTAISPTSIAPATASSLQNTVADFGQYSKDIPASWMANEKNLSLVQAPQVSPKEMAQIDRLIDRSRQAEAPAGTAGPPPFPLSLLPQQSLKQFVGAKPPVAARVAAPPSFFGSWHGNSQPKLASNNLAPAGFRTNMHGGNFGSYAAPHAGHKTAFVKQANNKFATAPAHHAQPVAPKVAAYAPYSTTNTF